MSALVLPRKVEDILKCDLCRSRIVDVMQGEIRFDSPYDPETHKSQPVTRLVLAHKQCARRLQEDLRYDFELCCFADPASALEWLAASVSDQEWSVEQLARLMIIAWAVTRAGAAYLKESKDSVSILHVY